jgi:SAM-dependent methyltransferase
MTVATPGNREAVEAWDGVLFDRFVQYRDRLVGGLVGHGNRALELSPPVPGERLLDLGCGFGDMTQQLAGLVGPGGSVVGVDAASRFIELARNEAAATGVENASFVVGDLQAMTFDERFDAAYSRFGTMFFANPVVALGNVRRALVPGGRLCMVVWRRKLDNDWVHRAELIAERYLTHPEQTNEPTCGPGPFSMAGADTTCDVLTHAGFEDIALRRVDMPIWLGADVAAAAEVVMALGPAGELIRINGAAAEPFRDRIETEIRSVLAEWEGPGGVMAPSSTWIVTATAPSVA